VKLGEARRSLTTGATKVGKWRKARRGRPGAWLGLGVPRKPIRSWMHCASSRASRRSSGSWSFRRIERWPRFHTISWIFKKPGQCPLRGDWGTGPRTTGRGRTATVDVATRRQCVLSTRSWPSRRAAIRL